MAMDSQDHQVITDQFGHIQDLLIEIINLLKRMAPKDDCSDGK